MSKVYCGWVDAEVEDSQLMNACHANIKGGRCTLCQRSAQLDYGVSAEEILIRAKEE